MRTSHFLISVFFFGHMLSVQGCTGVEGPRSGEIGTIPVTGGNSYSPPEENGPNVTIGWDELEPDEPNREGAQVDGSIEELDAGEGPQDSVSDILSAPDGTDGLSDVDGFTEDSSDVELLKDTSEDLDIDDEEDSFQLDIETSDAQAIDSDTEEETGKENCCELHATPGCTDPNCEGEVCEADPYCCDTAWDAKCLELANQICEVCVPGGVTNPCCEAHEQPGCSEADCQSFVCDADAYCCEVKWDALCAGDANESCAICIGEGPTEPDLDECCAGKDTPGCPNESCETTVCGIDPFCCQSAWDAFCASCAAGGEAYAGDSCAGVEEQCACTAAEWTHEDLAAYWAPVWYHDVDNSNTEGDYFTAIDADGDLVSSNNWESLDEGVTDLKGVVYWSVVETASHYFILYTNFHPQDWDEVCSVGPFYKVCHENDMEGAMVVVRKVQYTAGVFRVLYTEAHNHLYIYRNDSSISKKAGELRNVGVSFDNEGGSHPEVYVESGGHGVCALYHSEDVSLSADYCAHDMGEKMLECIDAGGGDACDPADYFPGGDGIVYRPKQQGEVPNGSFDKDVGYELRPFIEEIWPYRDNICDESCLFDGTFEYEGVDLAKAFDGDTWEDDKANPPWAWDSPDDGDVFRGDFFFRPAESLLIHLQMPEEVSLDYLYNPFLSAIDP